MFYSFDFAAAAGDGTYGQGAAQEGVTVGAPQLSLFDPDGGESRGYGPQAAPGGQTVEELIAAYLDATEASTGTRYDYQTTARKWAAWCKQSGWSLRSVRPKGANQVAAQDLDDWLNWVYQEALAEGAGNPGRAHNKSRANLHAVFKWACKPSVRRLAAMPAFPDRRKQRNEAGHYFLTDEEVSRLYWSTYYLREPKGWNDERSIGSLWRCALVLWRNYGLDTQILMPHTPKAVEVCTWSSVWTDSLPPGRVANCPCEHGWLALRRQKTGRSLFLPMEPVARAHIEAIRLDGADPESPILGGAGGGKPCTRFQELCELAKLTPKWDAESERPSAWEIKDLRKTCATVHDANIPGSGTWVLGHSTGTITQRHYSNSLPMLVKAVTTLPQPEAFRSILDPGIKPPPGTLLFAK